MSLTRERLAPMYRDEVDDLIELIRDADVEFQRIRWDWSDPRSEIQAGRASLQKALEYLGSTPVEWHDEEDTDEEITGN